MSGGWLSSFASDRSRLVADLEALVGLESPSEDANRVSRLARWIRDRLDERGVAAELRPCPPRGDALLASVGAPDGGTLLLGHLDTVWPAGTLAERPWRIDGGYAHGPGVFDMKAGIAVGLAVLAAVARESPPPPVSMLLVPDEEVGSAASRELTVSLARRHRQVLVLEPSQDGAAKVARKGCGTFQLRFSGRASHAGLAPEEGASALAEMARFVLFLDGVADPGKGTTLTATVGRAGTATNVVPEAAELAVDARAWSLEEADRVSAAVRAYAPSDRRVTIAVEGGFDRPPLEPTAASTALYERARRLAAPLGLDLGAARVGGGSDGNFTAAAGVPTLDGLGPRGGGAHARDEHVVIDDLTLRAALVAGLVCDAD
jgi:glutamate carboxypeptidase